MLTNVLGNKHTIETSPLALNPGCLKNEGADAKRPPQEIPHERSVELHCGPPLEQPKDDANRNQANETAITKLLDNCDQIADNVTSDKADHSTKENLKQDTNCYQEQSHFYYLAKPLFDCIKHLRFPFCGANRPD